MNTRIFNRHAFSIFMAFHTNSQLFAHQFMHDFRITWWHLSANLYSCYLISSANRSNVHVLIVLFEIGWIVQSFVFHAFWNNKIYISGLVWSANRIQSHLINFFLTVMNNTHSDVCSKLSTDFEFLGEINASVERCIFLKNQVKPHTIRYVKNCVHHIWTKLSCEPMSNNSLYM